MTTSSDPVSRFNPGRLQEALDSRANLSDVAVVFAVSFDGTTEVFASADAQVERAELPVKATLIKNLAGFSAVPFTQNPDAVMIDPNGIPYIIRK